MQFERELARVLPQDLPHRDRLIERAAQHLSLIERANEYMNLTRITSPQEAAIKHVFDCVAPWRFFAEARRVLDAGTGAGFPGIPLAVTLPQVRFTLAESIGKKARFVDSVIEELELANVQVAGERAEDVALQQRVDLITARAVAPIGKILTFFEKPLRAGARLLLYKGPDVEAELAEASKHRVHADVVWRYELPDRLGTRSLVQITASQTSANRVRRESLRTQAQASPR